MRSISKSSATNRGCSSFIIYPFLGLFIVVGLAAGWFMTGAPLLGVYRATSWPPRQCVVVSSKVGSSGDTFKVDIEYSYRVDGRDHTSNRYNFSQVSDSNHAGKQRVVDQYPVGRTFECFVDPRDPTRAIIDRRMSGDYLWGLLFTGMFAGIPGIVLLVLVKSARAGASSSMTHSPARAELARLHDYGHETDRSESISEDFTDESSTDEGLGQGRFASPALSGPLELKTTGSPLGKFVTLVVIALIWNGVTGVFTYFEVQEFMTGGQPWFLAIFLGLFQLIGVLLLVSVPYQMLALANPRPVLTLASGVVPVGGAITLQWQLRGAAGRVSALRITLQGSEEATYRRGTDTRTDRHTFYDATVIEVADSGRIPRGMTTLSVPRDTMHSFNASHNKVIWTLKVHGDIARWPDIDESFEINVTPQ